MVTENTKDRLIVLFAQCVGKSDKDICPDMEPVNDLKLDSIQILDFVIKVEEEFGVDFEAFSKVSQHMATVGEMVNFLAEVIGREMKSI